MDVDGLSSPIDTRLLLPVLVVACWLDGCKAGGVWGSEGGHWADEGCGGTDDLEDGGCGRDSARTRRGSLALRGSMKFCTRKTTA